MPLAPPTACPCGGLKHNGKCDRCGTSRGQHQRTTTERGYGHDWQEFRASIMRERPICERQANHPGIVRPSMELHHKRKIKDAPHMRLDPENVEALCEECHDAATAAGE